MEITFLHRALTAPGPFATVCADVTHTTENADTALELRVRALAERLTEQGAPAAAVDAVRARLLEGNEGGRAGTLRGRAVVADAGGVVLVDVPLVDAPRTEVAEWSPQPDLLPVLRQLPGRVPHLVVVTDRVGADITAVTEPGHPALETTVEGDTVHMRKLPGGGWAHLRYQHTAENVWIDNADEVAAVLDRLVGQMAARFVLLAGEERARAVLADRVTPRVAGVLVQMDGGGRAAGADREPIDRRAAELVAEHEARADAAVLEQIEAASAHGLAVTGTALVVEALRKSQVETLVLADQPDREVLFVGNTPLELGVDSADLAGMGVRNAHQVPADRALLAAADGSSAGVVVLPRAAMPGDIPVAAVLRYTDSSTPG
jgi:hypothetical protein